MVDTITRGGVSLQNALNDADAARRLAALDVSQRLRLQRMVSDRARGGVPIQYVLGEWPFADLTLTVRPPVLIPRPETEQWTRWIIDRYRIAAESDSVATTTTRSNPKPKSSQPPPPLCVVDLCTGSGAIALALAHHIPNSIVLGVDISSDAIALANHNKARVLQQPIKNVHFAQCDLFDSTALTALTRSTFNANAGPHLIVSNPPYITRAAYRALPVAVRRFEDSRALIGADSTTAPLPGMKHYEAVIGWARSVLQPHPFTSPTAGAGGGDGVMPQLVLEGSGTKPHERALTRVLQRIGYSSPASTIVSFDDYFGRARWTACFAASTK